MQATAVEIVLTGTVMATANYTYLPFEVPGGVTRIELSLSTSRRARVGLGLFDPRGAGYQSAGFRGIAGHELREVFIGLREATPGFTPGPITPGRWTVIVPVFIAVLPTKVNVRVRMFRGPEEAPLLPAPLPEVVDPRPGWYRGDLHCHTEASSDAWRSGSALTPSGWADRARARGLHFLAMTDHNVISQNYALARDAGDGVLLLAGEEMTNYFHGHATVSGIEPGQWFDFRQSPLGLQLPTRGARIRDFMGAVREVGGFVSAAHPSTAGMSWQFLADAVLDPAARPDALEVWNGGTWQLSEELAIRVWQRMLRHGWHIVANGGSDLHALVNPYGVDVGTPTTVVYAAALARRPIVQALRHGRSYVTRRPDGVEIYLTVAGPDGQHTYSGGTIHATPGSTVTAEVRVRRGGGMRVRMLTRDGCVATMPLDSDDATVQLPLTVAQVPTFVRAEVRGRARPPGRLPVPRLDMEAFTNPVRIAIGPTPPGTTPEYAPPPER